MYFYSKNYVVWTNYDKKTNQYSTEYRKINIPNILHLPLLRCLRMMYVKKQLNGSIPIFSLLLLIFIQYLLSLFNHNIIAFLLPYLLFATPIVMFNLAIKVDPNNELVDRFRNHAAEHLVSERMWFNKNSIYSFGCSNSHIILWFLINLILINFMPITLAYLLSMFISGEIAIWLLFNQESKIAKLFYPIVRVVQDFTLLEPREENIKLAELTINKLKELEDSEN